MVMLAGNTMAYVWGSKGGTNGVAKPCSSWFALAL